METPEIANAWANGEDVSTQIAGAITSSLFGYLGASLAGSLGASIATAIGLAGLPAFAVAAAFAVTGSIIAGYLAEAFTENHWGDWMNTLIESVPGWLENLDSLFNPGPIDPLVIDLDNDGIDLTDLNTSNAYFDLDGDGFRERTGWVAPDDGLLAVDINGNGKIDDISELFGSPTASGFAKLTAFDTNGNGVVNDQDSQFADLRIWQDLNGNGETDSGELRTLTEAGVASISLNASDVNYQVNGNQVVKTATVTMTSGVVTQAAEVLFAMSQAQSSYIMPAGFTYDTDVFKMPMLRGFGDMPDLWVSMSQNDQLKVDAHALIDQAKAGNFGNFADNFDDLLADWAGVADVVWMQDAPELSAAFAFDETEYAEWLVRENDGIAGANPLPTIRGYVFRSGSAFTPDAEYDAQVAAWLATNGYVAPGFDGDISTSGGPQLAVSINGGFTQQTLPFRIVPGTIGGADPTPAPAMDAAEFAFLQTLMGRSFTQATNFIAPENLLVANVTPQQVAALQASYDEVKHYMEARFLAQAAYTIIAEEGENADLGALAPFTNITFNPFTDELGGNVENFVTDLVNEFRTGTLGTDADALHILDIFGDEIGPLGGYVAENFLDIDRALIATVLGTAIVYEGGSAAESATLAAAGIALGHGGDDTIIGSSGSDALFGGAGNDSLSGAAGTNSYDGGVGNDAITGGVGIDTYFYALGDGFDTITDYSISSLIDDRLILSDLNAAQVSFSQNAGEDLVITMSNGETITITDHFDGTYEDMEQIQFADGSVLNAQGIRDKTVSDMKSTGAVIGSEHTNTYRHALGDGSYTITDYSISSLINDRLILTDLNAAQVSFSQNTGEDLIITMSNGETITITDHFDGTYEDMEQIQFADGTVLDAQGIRDKTVADMKATGAVIGSEHTESYRHALGDGSYTIKDYSISSVINDRLILTDLNAGQVTFWKNLGDDLVITMANGEAIIIADHFDGTYYDMEQIQFADGTVLDTQGILDKTTTDAATLGGMTIIGTALADVLYGGTSDDSLSGLGGNDTIYADTGNDTLDGGVGADSMIGGSGDDVFIVDDVLDKVSEASGGGNDLVQSSATTFTLAVNIEHLLLTGTTDISGSGNSSANTLTGNSGANLLFGSGGNDTLIGNDGNDTLDGGTGNDSMTGGAGNDTYSVDAALDSVVEDAAGGTDTVSSSIAYTLAANFENLILSGTSSNAGTGNELANLITGNSGTNNLSGLDGDDTLDGGGGADTLDGGLGTDSMVGGAGNDTFMVDVVTDVVSEAVGEGTDLVKSSISYALGLNVENLTLTGSALIDGTGTTSANVITGNAAANTLFGLAGNDTLSSGDGADILDGGEGIDSLAGGLGDDVFIVDDAADIISETSSGGVDTVHSSVSFTLATYVEHLTLTGNSAINGTGNTLANILTGNAEANLLSGGTGIDTLIGGAGNDTLDGGSSADSMTGGLGDDVFIVNLTTDKLVENADEGTDLVQSSVAWTLAANFENLTLTGTSGVAGTGNTVANAIVGNSGNNALSGLAGNDTLVGGGGNDSLNGGIGADQFVFTSTTSGIDVIADFNELDGGSEEGDVLRFDGLTVGTFVYLGASAFSGGSDNSEARVSGNQVLFDANGDGTADITIALTGLTSASQLAATDFLFV